MRGLVRLSTGDNPKAGIGALTNEELSKQVTPYQGAPYSQIGWSNPSGLFGSMYNRLQRSLRAEQTYGGQGNSVTWVYACTKLIANSLSRYPHQFVNSLTDEPIDEKKVPADLLQVVRFPNESQTYARMARAMQTDLELVGNSYWYEDGMNLLGQPQRLYRLQPERVRIVTDNSGVKKGYVYEIQGKRIPYTLDEIIHFRTDNPLDPIYGMGTVEALIREMDLEIGVQDHVIGFFQNGARIGGVLTIDSNMPDHVFERLQDQFNSEYGGAANAFKVLLAEKAMDYKPITQAPAAAGVVELAGLSKDRILKGFGVPDPLLGGTMENANYKMEEAQFTFADKTMDPRVKDFEQMMTLELTSRWGDIAFDVDVAYAEPHSVKIERAAKSAGTGTTINQMLDMQGLPEVDEEWANEPLILNKVIFARKLWEAKTVQLGPDTTLEDPEGEEDDEDDTITTIGSGDDEEGSEGNEDEPGDEDQPRGASDDEPPNGAPSEPAGEETGGKKSAELVMRETIAELLGSPDADKAAALPEVWQPYVKAAQEERVNAEVAQLRRIVGELPPPPGATLPPVKLAAGVMSVLKASDDAVMKGVVGAGSGPMENLTMPAASSLPPNVEHRHVQQLFDAHPATIQKGVDLLKPLFKAYLDGQQARILARLGAYGPTKTAHGTPTGLLSRKDISDESLFPTEQEDQLLHDLYLPAIDTFGQQAISVPAGIVGTDSKWEEANPYVQRQRQQIAAKVTRINDTTRSALGEILSVAAERGYSVRQIAQGVPKENFPGVQGVFGASDARAETIARTESAFIFNGATTAAYREAGLSQVYVLDGETDEECAAANGSTWSMEQAELEPVAHPNCVRSFAPVTSDGSMGEAVEGGG
jgi:HK97 family phage portal protein